MALATKLGTDLPEGAIALSREEALDHQKTLVEKWPIKSETIFLNYGFQITCAMTTVSTGIVFNYCRRAFNLKKSYTFLLGPTLFVPIYMSGRGAEKFITEDTLLMRIKCPLCSQLKFTALQSYTTLIFPLIYGLGSFTIISKIKNTYNFGNTLIDAKLFWKEMFKISKGGTRSYQLAGLLQVILIFGLPYMQNKEFQNIMSTIREIEKDDELLAS